MTFPAKHAHSGELSVHPVRDQQDLKRFIRVPWSIYAGDHSQKPLVQTRRMAGLGGLSQG